MILSRIAFLLLGSLFAAMAFQAKPPRAVAKAAAPNVRFTRVSAAAYAQARRQARPVQPVTTFPLRAQGRTLTIPTTAGPQVYRTLIVDAEAVAQGHSESEDTVYTYHGWLSRFQRHVVEVAFFETQQWWLIGPDGRRLTLYGEPIYGPDGQTIVAMCAGLEYSGGQPNIVQLLRLQEGKLRPFWQLQPADWEPEELFWSSPTTLYLKREDYPAGRQGPMSYWQLTVAPAP